VEEEKEVRRNVRKKKVGKKEQTEVRDDICRHGKRPTSKTTVIYKLINYT